MHKSRYQTPFEVIREGAIQNRRDARVKSFEFIIARVNVEPCLLRAYVFDYFVLFLRRDPTTAISAAAGHSAQPISVNILQYYQTLRYLYD